MNHIVKFESVYKSFGDINVLSDFDLIVYEREFLIITGRSGSGKSTILNLIGLLDIQNKGTISIFGKKNIKPLSRDAEKILHSKIGYLFQNFALIDNETILYNLEIVFDYKINKAEKLKKINEVLQRVNINKPLNTKVFQCSGGEQQRIALARLMLKKCELILADEPTGSLDDDNKVEVMEILKQLQKDGKTIVLVTHDTELFSMADRIIEL